MSPGLVGDGKCKFVLPLRVTSMRDKYLQQFL